MGNWLFLNMLIPKTGKHTGDADAIAAMRKLSVEQICNPAIQDHVGAEKRKIGKNS